MPSRLPISIATALAILTVASCSQPEKPAAPAASPVAPAAQAEAAPASAGPVDPGTAGSISVTVKLDGPAPERQPVPVGSVAACAAHWGGNPPLSTAVLVKDGLVQNSFVHIRSGLKNHEYPKAEQPVELDQVGCIYTPRVVGVRVNQPVNILNSDSMLHNVHTVSKANRPFNIAQPFKGKMDTKVFGKPEVMIKTKCDVHPWMAAFIGVVDHPYFGVTGEKGEVTISGVPPGTYQLEAWHEVFGTLTQEVTVGEKETVAAAFTFTAN